MQRIFTQSFVHRTHLEIFGFLYPPVFRNWYSDDWISEVYKPDWKIQNHGNHLFRFNPLYD